MRTLSICLVLTCAVAVHAESPGDAIAQASKDLQGMPVAQRPYLRYLSLYNLTAKERPEMRKVMAFHINSLSRRAKLAQPFAVSEDLLRINVLDYGWDPKVWDKLASEDPYFHAVVEVEVEVVEKKTVQQEYGHYQLAGQRVEKGADGKYPVGAVFVQTKVVPEEQEVRTKKKERKAGSAPWLPTKEMVYLIQETQSQIPVVRADWFLYQTAVQADRKAGYYDFLGLGKKETDFQSLIGADPKKAREVYKEAAAIIGRSGVTLNNRSMTRLQAITGPYWFTQDYKTSANRQNVLRLLDGDADPPQGDASEQYGTLPNGLFAFWLQNDKGVRQDTAPDTIASDGQAPGTDRRVHVGLSCIRCHVEGIRPIEDWSRKFYRGDIKLTSPDYEKLLRLEQLYLSNIEKAIKRDQDDYADALKEVNGFKPAENAKAYGKVWQRYAEDDVTLDDAAREWGVEPKIALERLKVYGKANVLADPVLLGYVQTPIINMRREHFEELFSASMQIMSGAK